MCGIIGFCGKPGAKPDPLKIRLLGMHNRSRGMDSIGIYFNGNTKYGVGKSDKGDFSLFSSDYKFDIKGRLKYGNTLLLHNRAASKGAVNVENAHPFLYDDKDGSLEMVLMHNGTIKDEYDLRKEVDVDYSKYDVDSELFGIVLHRDRGDYSILEKYKGSAALAWTWLDEPNTVYLWKGASFPEEDNRELTTERPLYYYYDSKDKGIYFCSYKHSLSIVSNFEEEIKPVPMNTVVKIQNGEIVEETKINREFVNKDDYATGGWHSRIHEGYTMKTKATNYNNSYANSNYSGKNRTAATNAYNNYSNKNTPAENIDVPNPKNSVPKDRVYYFFGKVYINDKPLNGVVRIDNDYKITDDESVKEQYYYNGVRVNSAKDIEDMENNNYNTYVAVHPDFLYKGNSRYWFKNKVFINGGTIVPDYSPYKYTFEDDVVIKYCENPDYYEVVDADDSEIEKDNDVFEAVLTAQQAFDLFTDFENFLEELYGVVVEPACEFISTVYSEFGGIRGFTEDFNTNTMDSLGLGAIAMESYQIANIIAYCYWDGELRKEIYEKIEDYLSGTTANKQNQEND